MRAGSEETNQIRCANIENAGNPVTPFRFVYMSANGHRCTTGNIHDL